MPTKSAPAKRLVALLALCMLFALPVLGEDANLRLTQDVQTVLPDGWLLGSENPDFPFQLVYSGDGAEILFFESVFDADALINNEEELRVSVDRVVAEVIETLPDGKLLTSTGFYETYRAGFVLEFTSVDTLAEAELRHRLMGIVYRLPDDTQLMFTIWGKSNIEQYGALASDIKMVQERFVYSGPQESHVFGQPFMRPSYLLLLMGILILGLLFFMRKRKDNRRGSVETSPDHFWHCSCGRVNHVGNDTCRRCGRKQETSAAI